SATATINPVILTPPDSKMPRYRHSTSPLTDGQAETPSQLNHIDRVRRKIVGNFPRIASTSTTCGWWSSGEYKTTSPPALRTRLTSVTKPMLPSLVDRKSTRL